MHLCAERWRDERVTPKQIKQWLARKERSTVEFKEAHRELPRSLFETVCAFLNRDGGVILLGVNDRGQVAGVEPNAVERLVADIVNLSNNPQKLDPPHLLAPDLVDYEGKIVKLPGNSREELWRELWRKSSCCSAPIRAPLRRTLRPKPGSAAGALNGI